MRPFLKNRFGLVFVSVVLALIEIFSFLRWMLFYGPKPDWRFPVGMFVAFWLLGNIVEWFEQMEYRRKSQLNDIETRLEWDLERTQKRAEEWLVVHSATS